MGNKFYFVAVAGALVVVITQAAPLKQLQDQPVTLQQRSDSAVPPVTEELQVRGHLFGSVLDEFGDLGTIVTQATSGLHDLPAASTRSSQSSEGLQHLHTSWSGPSVSAHRPPVKPTAPRIDSASDPSFSGTFGDQQVSEAVMQSPNYGKKTSFEPTDRLWELDGQSKIGTREFRQLSNESKGKKALESTGADQSSHPRTPVRPNDRQPGLEKEDAPKAEHFELGQLRAADLNQLLHNFLKNNGISKAKVAGKAKHQISHFVVKPHDFKDVVMRNTGRDAPAAPHQIELSHFVVKPHDFKDFVTRNTGRDAHAAPHQAEPSTKKLRM